MTIFNNNFKMRLNGNEATPGLVYFLSVIIIIMMLKAEVYQAYLRRHNPIAIYT